MFKFKKELSLKEAEHIARDSVNHILNGYVVCIRRKNWVDNLFVIYISSFFYVKCQPVLVIADTWGYKAPYKFFYNYTHDEEDASDWELVKIDADEYRDIRVVYESDMVDIGPYDVTSQTKLLNNIIGMSYPTYTGMLLSVDSQLDNRQLIGNYTFDNLGKRSHDMSRQPKELFYFRTEYVC